MKYLSPKQLGQAIGVSESSLKRWIDDGRLGVARTSGGHRRVSVAEAVRFVRDNGYVVLDAATLGLTASDDQLGRASDDLVYERLLDLLQTGRDTDFRESMVRLYLDGRSLHEIIDGPFRRAMQTLGELWHFNPDGVGIEHRATDISIRAIGYLHALVPPVPPEAPIAVGGTPPGDFHLLASLCVALVLAEKGWREANIGANTPWDQFVPVAKRERASLVWLSLTSDPPEDLADRIRTLAGELAALSCQLIIGGRQVADGLRRLNLPNLHTAGSMAELVAYSGGVRSIHQT